MGLDGVDDNSIESHKRSRPDPTVWQIHNKHTPDNR